VWSAEDLREVEKFRRRLAAGEKLADEEMALAIEVLTQPQRDVLLLVLEAMAAGREPDIEAIAGALKIHRTSAARRLRRAGRLLPAIWNHILDIKSQDGKKT
jgi:hypothetical protein